MSTVPTGETPALPVQQQEVVLSALQSILDSHHFSKSKRYPALLEYVVMNTLQGNSGALKERVVGAEVFGRSAAYDPGTDPVVRIAAGEVRRRLAEYFSEHPDAPVRIELPRGGYTVEFHFRVDVLSPTESISAASVSANPVGNRNSAENDVPVPEKGNTAPIVPWWPRKIAFVALAVVVLAAAAGWIWHSQYQHTKRDFWWPLLHTSRPAIIVVGRHRGVIPGTVPGSGAIAPESPDSAGRMNLLMDDVIVTAQMCNVFRMYGHDCTVVSAPTVTESDIRGKSIVVLGGFNNLWALKIAASLPLQFQGGLAANGTDAVRMIVEHTPAGNAPRWTLDAGQDRPSVMAGRDYAIIARFDSDLTNSTAVWIAGLGPEGTSGAGRFLASPDRLTELFSHAPKDWKGTEFEAVLEINYEQRQPVSEHVVDARFW